MNKKLLSGLLVILISGFTSALEIEELNQKGIYSDIGLTNTYQANVNGGLSTSDHNGRYTGSYDLEINVDLQRLLQIENSSIYILIEGSWPDQEGITPESVGSYFSVNDDAAGNRSMDITELWFETHNDLKTFRFRAGKMDLTAGYEFHNYPVAFDTSFFANDETSQFLNSALVNNPQIPFPDNGISAAFFLEPIHRFYISAGVQDAQADARETGFNTAFHGEDHFFYIAETGILSEAHSNNGPMPGALRAGIWYDPQPKERFESNSIKRDDFGFYTNYDQFLYKENKDEEDMQGLGIFLRAGYSDQDVSDLNTFISLGLSYAGLIEGRDDDVAGLGYARGIFSDKAPVNDSYESVYELYYNASVSQNARLTPNVQFIKNPAADSDADDALILGCRLQLDI